MKIRTLTLVLAGATSLMTGAANAAIMVTNGDFEAAPTPGDPLLNGRAHADVPFWFDSNASAFSVWLEIANADPQTNGSQNIAMGNPGFAYQSLGTLNFSGGTLNWSIDLTRFLDGNASTTLNLRFYSGDPTGTAADGTDITTLGLTEIDDTTIAPLGSDPAGTGFQAVTGSVDLAGLSAGTQIWIELDTAGGFSPFDNIVVTEVPEPGSLALLGLGGLAVLSRRRK